MVDKIAQVEDRLLILKDRVDVLNKTFNPSQPRDKTGRWTDGSSSGAIAESRAEARRARIQNIIHSYVTSTFGVAPDQLRIVIKKGTEGPMGAVGQVRRYQNTRTGKTGTEMRIWPMRIKREDKEFNDAHSATLRSVIAHEATHIKAEPFFDSAQGKAWLTDNQAALTQEIKKYWGQHSEYVHLHWNRVETRELELQVTDNKLAGLEDNELKSILQESRSLQVELLGYDYHLAVEETLAEMTNARIKSGQAPEGKLINQLYNRVMQGTRLVKNDSWWHSIMRTMGLHSINKVEDRILILKDRVDVLNKTFNPDEARDDHGRWSSSNDGFVGTHRIGELRQGLLDNQPLQFKRGSIVRDNQIFLRAVRDRLQSLLQLKGYETQTKSWDPAQVTSVQGSSYYLSVRLNLGTLGEADLDIRISDHANKDSMHKRNRVFTIDPVSKTTINEVLSNFRKITKFNPDEIEDRTLILKNKLDELFFILGKEFNPAQPRDQRGRWSTTGNHIYSRDIVASERHMYQDRQVHYEVVSSVVNRVVSQLGFDPSRVRLVPGIERSHTNGIRAGSYDTRTGQLTVYPDALTAKTAEGTAAHEVMHGKFHAVQKRYHAEALLATRNRGVGNFPVYERMYDHFKKFNNPTPEIADNGATISNYTAKYWHMWHQGEANTEWAVNETLAEMSRIEHTHGYVPGSRDWQEFYHSINEIYPTLYRRQ